MKILFLDIDGVLNSTRSCVARKGYPLNFSPEAREQFDWIAVDLIRRLCEEADVKIVLSSSWRIIFKADVVARELELPIIDSTPVLHGDKYVRGDEIKAWLDQHPEVTEYAIVDDDSDMLQEQIDGCHFIQTNFEEGLTWANYSELVRVFERQPCSMGEHACENRSQCFEPCGALGHDEKHARVHTGPVPEVEISA